MIKIIKVYEHQHYIICLIYEKYQKYKGNWYIFIQSNEKKVTNASASSTPSTNPYVIYIYKVNIIIKTYY